ncbi:50S ribosomal protein L34e [Candidatus Micrarchaeota archaeon CG10_big_fil_rev_8_21_14_0_10_45_29]|nr:MAG: 50S ribosomal protein L34e [Candidatus Micrarchaeota archaeon CG10_big_fil_rev_8_21_14_0_10_45_29]
MPLPKNRSNSVRKIKYRAPDGTSRVRYRRRKKGKTHRCAISGEKLTGVHSTQSVAKTKRRPTRPFGGRLSPSVSRKVLKLRSRLAEGEITMDEVPIEFLPYMKGKEKK